MYLYWRRVKEVSCCCHYPQSTTLYLSPTIGKLICFPKNTRTADTEWKNNLSCDNKTHVFLTSGCFLPHPPGFGEANQPSLDLSGLDWPRLVEIGPDWFRLAKIDLDLARLVQMGQIC